LLAPIALSLYLGDSVKSLLEFGDDRVLRLAKV